MILLVVLEDSLALNGRNWFETLEICETVQLNKIETEIPDEILDIG